MKHLKLFENFLSNYIEESKNELFKKISSSIVNIDGISLFKINKSILEDNNKFFICYNIIFKVTKEAELLTDDDIINMLQDGYEVINYDDYKFIDNRITKNVKPKDKDFKHFPTSYLSFIVKENKGYSTLMEAIEENMVDNKMDIFNLRNEISNKIKNTSNFSDKYLSKQYPNHRFFGNDGELVYSINGSIVSLYFNPTSLLKFNKLSSEIKDHILSNTVSDILDIDVNKVIITNPRSSL
jgi:hypothetical protein